MSELELEFNALIRDLLNLGVEITMKVKDGAIIWYDLNTGMKSDLHLYFDGESVKWKGRYGEGTLNLGKETGFNVINVMELVKECLCGRTYCSHMWVEAFRKMAFELFDE